MNKDDNALWVQIIAGSKLIKYVLYFITKSLCGRKLFFSKMYSRINIVDPSGTSIMIMPSRTIKRNDR